MERLSALYASALYKIALEKNAVDDFLAQAEFLRDVLKEPDCHRVLVHPQISANEKREFFKKTVGEHIHEDFLGFLYLVVDKNREAFLIPALEALISIIKRHNKIVTAKVMSAAAYDNEQAEELRAMLSKKLGKHVELSMKVDPALIGGPYIFVDGYYIDWTVKKRLRDLTVSMKEGCSA